MKKVIVLIAVFMIGLPLTGQNKAAKEAPQYQLPKALAKEIQDWPLEKLQYFSMVYLELGKTFYNIKKINDSQACFLYAIQVYPMGEPAMEAKKYLKQYWNIQIP